MTILSFIICYISIIIHYLLCITYYLLFIIYYFNLLLHLESDIILGSDKVALRLCIQKNSEPEQMGGTWQNNNNNNDDNYNNNKNNNNNNINNICAKHELQLKPETFSALKNMWTAVKKLYSSPSIV